MAQAILLVDQREHSDNIRILTETGRSRAFSLRKQFLTQGISAIDVKTRGLNRLLTKKQLVKIREIYPTQKVLLLWDGPGSHKGKEVRQFVEGDGRTEVIYFPPYAPEENPQEHVWKEGRSQVSHNRFIENIDEATDDFVNFLNTTKFAYKLLNIKSTFEM